MVVLKYAADLLPVIGMAELLERNAVDQHLARIRLKQPEQ